MLLRLLLELLRPYDPENPSFLQLFADEEDDGADGDDYLDGGAGTNTLSFTNVSSGINVNLSSSAYTYETTTVNANTAISKATDTDSNGTNDGG